MKLKKLLPLIGLGAMTAVLLSACGGNSAKKDSAEAATSDEPITIMAPYIETTPPADGNVVQKAIEKYTDTKIKMSWVPNTSYGDKTNIVMAGDAKDMPEVMVISKTAGFIKSAQAGAYWDLTDKLKDYPNLAKSDENIVEASSVNGTVYGIYRGRDLVRSTAIIRKDWLENLGLEEPKTVEDLYNVAKAFTEEDPDGNGQNDTVGINIPKWPNLNNGGPYDLLATWLGAGNGWVEKDGKLIPSFETDEYMDSLKLMQKMVQEGLVNKDFATLETDKWNDNFVSGKAGIILDTYSRAASLRSLFNQQEEGSGNDKVLITGNLANNDGTTYSLPTDGYSSFLAIPKASVKTEEDLDRVLTFLDKLNDTEMLTLLNIGIEGENFEYTDDTKQYYTLIDTPEASAVTDATKSFAQISMGTTGEKLPKAQPATDGDKEFAEVRATLEARDAKTAVFNPTASFITDTYTTKGAQLDQIIGDARTKYFAGQLDDAGWQAAVELWQSSGGNDLIEETNALNK